MPIDGLQRTNARRRVTRRYSGASPSYGYVRARATYRNAKTQSTWRADEGRETTARRLGTAAVQQMGQ
jgi:hypothetical protein